MTMEEEKGAKLRRFANKLAVKSEPGLTTAQLMVGSPTRRHGRIPNAWHG